MQWKPSVTLVSGVCPLHGSFLNRIRHSALTLVFAGALPSTVLAIIKDKVNHPSPDDPFEPDIAVQLKNDKAKFLATAKEWTKKCVIVQGKKKKQLTYSFKIRDVN